MTAGALPLRGASARSSWPRVALLSTVLALLLALFALGAAQAWMVLDNASQAQVRLLGVTRAAQEAQRLQLRALRLGERLDQAAPPFALNADPRAAEVLRELRAGLADLNRSPALGAAEWGQFALLRSALANLGTQRLGEQPPPGPAPRQAAAAWAVADAAGTLAAGLLRRAEAETVWVEVTGACARQRLLGLGAATGALLLVLAALVAETLRERRRALRRLEALARQDGLTGVANRRLWDQRLSQAAGQAARSGQLLSLVMLDLDHFKAFNDRRGHQAGDDLLRGVAGLLARAADPQVTVARYGGEEFSLLWPGQTPQAVGEWLDRLRAGVPGDVTFSAGVTGLRPGEGAQQALQRADEALYAAKHAGRARTVVLT